MWLEVVVIEPGAEYPIMVNTDHVTEIRSMDVTRDGTCMLMFANQPNLVVNARYRDLQRNLTAVTVNLKKTSQQNPQILTEDEPKPIPFKPRGTTTAAINQG